MSHSLIQKLSKAAAAGEASRNGVEFARFISRMAPSEPEGVLLGAYLACAVIDDSHTCIDVDEKYLEDFAKVYLSEPFDMAKISEQVVKSRIVGKPGDALPLIFHDGKLYLHRYFSYECTIAKHLIRRASSTVEGIDVELAKRKIDEFFPRSPIRPDWQKIAVFNSLFRRLTVISGGPGTGKTRTVTALMALLASVFAEKRLIISMCAPTGKAAARLTESVAKASSELGISAELLESLPTGAQTIHRLLGAGRKAGRFRYHRENPLPCDVLIVDEASMVDLPMMVHLMEALRDEAVLVLLGDKDQLASVEAGSVMRDICAGLDRYGVSDGFVQRCAVINEDISDTVKSETDPPPLRNSIINLTHSYRFGKKSGIGQLSEAVNQGDLNRLSKILKDRGMYDAEFVESTNTDILSIVREKMVPHASKVTKAESVSHALDLLDEFKVLCGLKRGLQGVDFTNQMLRSMLLNGNIHSERGLYKGMPIIINRNDYMLDLYNGDTGVLWPDDENRLRAWFRGGDGSLRSFAVSRLPSFHEAWAITVHRSQGSEYENVLFLLPPEDSAMPGRELLYTAITRARKSITVWGGWNDLKACVTRRTRRNSGLAKALWGS